MTASLWTSKTGDTKPLMRDLEVRGDTGDWLPAPIPAGSTVRFILRTPDLSRKLCDAPATVVEASPLRSRVRYDWAAGGNSEAGFFWGEFEVRRPDGRVDTYPGGPSLPYVPVLFIKSLGGVA